MTGGTEFRTSGVYSGTDNVTVQSATGILQLFGYSQANMRIGIAGVETYGVTLQQGTSDVFFAPYSGSNEKIYLGTNSRRWKTVYCTGTNTSSDAKVKENIHAIDCNDEFIEFCENLVPSYYTMKNGDTGRRHSGFIAQPLAELANKTIGDLSLFQAEGTDSNGNPCYYDPSLPDDKLNWGLDYQQLIPILWRYVQYLSSRIKALEERENDNN
ncbi:MAG: tail fiber domain-containing protein [Clostridium sp.]|nr:tail fiber domain-containing protein [Clostridium sp.]